MLLLAACGTATQQPIKAQAFSLDNKGVVANNGSDVYVADPITGLVAEDSWSETATLTLPQSFSCPKGGHYGVSGWVGLYAGTLQAGHFYQAVVANLCDSNGWYFQLSDIGVVNSHGTTPVLIDTSTQPASVPAGSIISLTLDFDGSGGYTASFTLSGQTYSASLQNGIAPNQPEFGLECPRLASGLVTAPTFDKLTLSNMAFNGIRLNQWKVTQYKTASLKETSGLTASSNSITVVPA